jgi:hypothetical protein
VSKDAERMLGIVDKFLEENEVLYGVCKRIHARLGSLRETIDEAGETLSTDLVKRVENAVPHIETILDNVLKTDALKYFDEFFYSDIFPLLMEWQVVEERFMDRSWGQAYKIKLAEAFFASMGQLCLSLRKVLESGRGKLLETF